MGLFEDVVFNVKTTAGVVGKKAADVIDISKLKYNLAEINREIGKEYAKLGKLCYDDRKHGDADSDGANQIVARIDALFEQKNAISDKILAFLNKKKCQNCCEVVNDTAKYCSNCGVKFEVAAEEDVPDDEEISI